MVPPEDYEKHQVLIDLEKAILFNRKLPPWFKEYIKMRLKQEEAESGKVPDGQ